MGVPKLLEKYGVKAMMGCDKRKFSEELCSPTMECYTTFKPMYHPERKLSLLIDGFNETQLVRKVGTDFRPTIKVFE